jgi:hypothetical protein
MLGLLLGAQQIELIGGGSESWFSHNAIAIAAITAAGLAAFVAVRNQRRQLAHDRLMRSRDYVRDAIDEAAKAAGEARIAAEGALEARQELEQRRDEIEKAKKENPGGPRLWGISDLVDVADEKRHLAKESLNHMREARSRLNLRLAHDDPVVVAYENLREALRSLFSVDESLKENRAQGVRDADEARREAVQDAHAEFRRTGVAWMHGLPKTRLRAAWDFVFAENDSVMPREGGSVRD